MFNPEQEEGPYYVDRELLRSDITEGKIGVPLRVRVTIVDAKTCAPLPNAALDIWHCDAGGVYSGYTKINPGGSGGMPPKPRITDDLVFLRGVQITDAKGIVKFTTIYPGHDPGRVNHIHMKVHIGGGATKSAEGDAAHAAHPGVEVYAVGQVAHTGQLFFSEDESRFVEATHPNSGIKVRRTVLEEDMGFDGQSGAGSVAKLTPVTSTQLSDGYVSTLTVAVDPGLRRSGWDWGASAALGIFASDC